MGEGDSLCLAIANTDQIYIGSTIPYAMKELKNPRVYAGEIRNVSRKKIIMGTMQSFF
jgi:hypothetical protein